MSDASTRISLREVYQISRPLWWVTTAMPFVGSFFVLAGVHDWRLYVGALFFAIPYNVMMYGINDIYDYESDIRNPRKTDVLPRSKHKSLWLAIIALTLPLLVVLYAVGSLAANLWLTFMLFMVVAYSQKGLRFKEIPFVDSLTSSFHYTSPFIYGGLLVGADNLYVAGFIAFYIWALANHAFGAIQDITPDREAGIQSIARWLGAPRTIMLCTTIYAVAAVLPVVFYGSSALVASLLLLPYVAVMVRTWPYRHDDTSPIFRTAWKRFIYINYAVGFVLTFVLLYYFKPFNIGLF